ncbi:MAG: hypothetical protein Q8M16_18585 [Pirellulaceae bacterium]|nr:hypothetical protein [Pirellulaceae bacterium]
MSMIDELTRRLPLLLHVLITMLAIPYVMLACVFLIIGRMAAQRGLWDAFDAFLNSLNLAMGWGALLFVLVLTSILVAGFFESLRWWGSLALLTLLISTLGVLIFYRPTFPTLGEFLFLTPALLFVVICVWQLIPKK